MSQARVFFLSSFCIFTLAIVFGFIIPDVRLPIGLEIVIKVLAALSVISIIVLSLLVFIRAVRRKSLKEYVGSSLGAATASLSASIALLAVLYISGAIYGKAIAGAVFMSLIFSVIIGGLFFLLRPFFTTHSSRTYPVVGRLQNIDLEKYTITVQGRDIIDYEKIKNEDPDLYRKVLINENKPDPYLD